MLEIDGELFDDPCEEKRKEKNTAIIELIIKSAIACFKVKNKLECQIITDMTKVTIGAIMIQPLWPKFAVGGIVVSLPNSAGDNLFNSSECIIGVDPGIKSGDISVQHEVNR